MSSSTHSPRYSDMAMSSGMRGIMPPVTVDIPMPPGAATPISEEVVEPILTTSNIELEIAEHQRSLEDMKRTVERLERLVNLVKESGKI